MTYVMPVGLYSPDVYDIARKECPCSCEPWVPIAVGIPDSIAPRVVRGVEIPRDLGTYCVRCRRRSSVTVTSDVLLDIPNDTIEQLLSLIPCDHFSAWEITPWLVNRHDVGMFGRKANYDHLLYCRTCRRVYKVQLAARLSVRKGDRRRI